MRHLTAADYVTMPWANGRGQTVEILRVNGADGSLKVRLSMASVVEDGPFSLFPGIERNLTVISGPGFDLTGDVALRADPLVPVAFPGDVAVAAAGVSDACDDFNVMWARRLRRPVVQVIRAGLVAVPEGGALCLFALEPAWVDGLPLARHDLLVLSAGAIVAQGAVIAVVLDFRL